MAATKRQSEMYRKRAERAEIDLRPTGPSAPDNPGRPLTRSCTEGDLDARDFVSAILSRLGPAHQLMFGNDSDSDSSDSSSKEAGEFLARHVPSSVFNLSDVLDAHHIEVAQAAISETARRVGPEGLITICESMFTSTFWACAGKFLGRQLGDFSDKVLRGDVAFEDNYRDIWNQLPGALLQIIFASTSGQSEIRGLLGAARNEILMDQSVTVALLLMYIKNPQCSSLLQEPVSLMLRTGMASTTTAQRFWNHLGVSCSLSTSLSRDEELRQNGRRVVLALIRLAVSLGFPLILIFDNVDWNRLADVAIHMMLFIVWFGDKAKCEVPTRRYLADLKAGDLVNISAQGMLRALRARQARAEVLSREFLDVGSEEKIVSLTEKAGAAVQAIQARRHQRATASLGRPASEFKLTPTHSARHSLQARAAKAELAELRADTPRLAEVRRDYVAPASSVVRSMYESAPMSVHRGETLLLLAEFDDPSLKLLLVKRHSTDEYGYIPKSAITDVDDDEPPMDRRAFLTTPVTLRKPSVLRHDAVKTSSFLSDPSDSTDSDIGDDDSSADSDSLMSDEAGSEIPAPLDPENRPIDDDRAFMARAKAVVRELGGSCPPHYESTVHLLTADERSSDLLGWRRAELQCMTLIAEATEGLTQKAVIIKVSDQQEHGAFFKDQDRRREELVKHKKQLERLIDRSADLDADAAQVAKHSLTKAQDALKAIDDETAHVLGKLHANFAAIRGWGNSHASITLKGMLEWSGLGYAFEAITTCKSGYYKIAMDVLYCAHMAMLAETDVLAKELIPATADDASIIPVRMKLLSTTFGVYYSALVEQTEPILNMQLASRRRGDEARYLTEASIKGVTGIYTTGGNHNYWLSAMTDVRQLLIAPQDQQAALVSNTTVVNRRRQR